uniref:Uncharacterized protein n=1 Tax=Solanum tuberosum TaxID=4113 RepID=M1DW91_SOLTU
MIVQLVIQTSLTETSMAGPSGASDADVYGLRNKARTLICKKESELKNEENSSVPRPEGKNQVGEIKEQSTDRRGIPRCIVGSPKIIDLEDDEGQGKKGDGNDQREARQVDRRDRLIVPSGSS